MAIYVVGDKKFWFLADAIDYALEKGLEVETWKAINGEPGERLY